MDSKTVEIRLKLSEEELAQLCESLEKSVSELTDELEETLDDADRASEVAGKIRASQSVRCKIAIQEKVSCGFHQPKQCIVG